MFCRHLFAVLCRINQVFWDREEPSGSRASAHNWGRLGKEKPVEVNDKIKPYPAFAKAGSDTEI